VRFSEALAGVRRLFLDTAPVIYHVQPNPTFGPRAARFFQEIEAGGIEGVTSSITQAETLVIPIRSSDHTLVEQFRRTITAGVNTLYVGVDPIVEEAAALQARYRWLHLPDALQLAAAIAAHCEAFLTNDRDLKRVTEIRVLVLDEIEIDEEDGQRNAPHGPAARDLDLSL
jgi:predicted nucleic acid-binding protein